MNGAAVRSDVGPRVVGIGMAIVAVAYVGYSADHRSEQSAAAPRTPASSAPPATAKPKKPTRPSHSPSAPRAKPHRVPNTGRVVVAARSTTGSGGGTSPRRPHAPAPSGPAPHPPAAPPPSVRSCDVGVTALALKACLNLGAR